MCVITGIWLAIQAQAQEVYFFEKKIRSFKGYNMKLFQRNNADQIIQSHGKKIHDNYIPNSLLQLLIMRFERILTTNLPIRFVVIWRELVCAIK